MNGEPAFAHVLHAETIAKLARGASLARGRAYFAEGRVSDLEKKAGRIVGRVRGGASYLVSIWSKGDGLGYTCSCPAGGDGAFCKHCVAVALAWLAERATSAPSDCIDEPALEKVREPRAPREEAEPTRASQLSHSARVAIDSSVIAAVEYNPRTSNLEIEFRQGDTYRYFDVPAVEYRGLLTAPSKGRFFHERIESVYRYERARRR